jgi:hypothetical protein
VQTDESEICVYHGTCCFDGLSPVVVVDKPVREPERINDFTHSCMDPRFYEPSSLEDGGCAYMNSGMRKARCRRRRRRRCAPLHAAALPPRRAAPRRFARTDTPRSAPLRSAPPRYALRRSASRCPTPPRRPAELQHLALAAGAAV